MEWIERLSGGTVGLDTAPLIYLIEEHKDFLPVVESFFSGISKGDFSCVTSTVTLLEVLVHPLRAGNDQLAQQYRSILLGAEGLRLISLSPEIAEEASRLRSKHNIATPDAIQLATAKVEGASFFFTNDSGLPSVEGLEILVLGNLS